jgi:heme-degrading monooxygenase HmoA
LPIGSERLRLRCGSATATNLQCRARISPESRERLPTDAAAVILRILTARVPRENVGQFNDLLRAQLSELRDQPGLVYVKLARRLDENEGEEVLLVEEWRTPSDVFAWTRGRLTKPRLLPGTEDLVEDLSISHYEALDLSPDDLAIRVLGDAAARPAGAEVASDAEQRRPEPVGVDVETKPRAGGHGPKAIPRPRLVSRQMLQRPIVHVGRGEQGA